MKSIKEYKSNITTEKWKDIFRTQLSGLGFSDRVISSIIWNTWNTWLSYEQAVIIDTLNERARLLWLWNIFEWIADLKWLVNWILNENEQYWLRQANEELREIWFLPMDSDISIPDLAGLQEETIYEILAMFEWFSLEAKSNIVTILSEIRSRMNLEWEKFNENNLANYLNWLNKEKISSFRMELKLIMNLLKEKISEKPYF